MDHGSPRKVVELEKRNCHRLNRCTFFQTEKYNRYGRKCTTKTNLFYCFSIICITRQGIWIYSFTLKFYSDGKDEKKHFQFDVLHQKNKLLKTGEAPIMLRVTMKGKYAEITMKRSILVSLWNQAKECSNGRSHKDKDKELNRYLDTVKARIFEIQRLLENGDQVVSARRIVDYYNGKREDSRTIVEIFTEHNNQCGKLIGVDFTAATVKKFETSLSHLQEFMKIFY
ncbi:hypothetical protein M2137_000415 [Parabacteroides sp. PFB2-10]|uniref:Arm DNA-binding domain-containing protein n=1 Tax=Parabacteroides sp. PFB2-10 TaxID=1742405 RepID=UPI002475234C|nr:Arm DNA-binding domain-containing protein [Parabacteroides sp. PFB2-10]MDH6311656.1 hypothetical protein [Parabacteroides sp. PFB2-10]